MPPNCLRCGSELSAFTGVTPESIIPTTGATSLCLYCGALAMFVVDEKGISLREPTEGEYADLMQDQVVIDALAARQLVMDVERPPRGASWCTCRCHHSISVKHIVACCHPDEPDPTPSIVRD